LSKAKANHTGEMSRSRKDIECAIDLPNSYVFTWKAPTGPTRDYNRVEKTGFAFSNHPNPRYRTVHNKRSAVNYRTQAGNSANARVWITYFNPHFPS
jgi:hypothetical protein